MPFDLSPYNVALGGFDYPVKYAQLLPYVQDGLNNLAGFKNRIINGKMDIAQRGTSFAGVTSAYTLDRWQAIEDSDGSITVSQQSDVPSNNEFQSSLRLAVTTADTAIAASQYSGLAQLIEGYNVRDLIGRTCTLSFWVRSSKTGIHCVSFRNDGGDRSYVVEYTVSAANTWEQKFVTVSGGLITAGTWNWINGVGLRVFFMVAAGSTWQTAAGAWQTGNFLATSAQVNCLDTIGNIFAITGVQLEPGPVATPFEHRPVATERALCRAYTRVQAYQVPAGTAQNLGTIDMRATPTISGGGAGFTSTGTTADQLIAFQTTAGVQTLTLNSEL
jgi:hypothetical protein